MLKSSVRTYEALVMRVEEWAQVGFKIIGITNLQQGFRVRPKVTQSVKERGDALCLQEMMEK